MKAVIIGFVLAVLAIPGSVNATQQPERATSKPDENKPKRAPENPSITLDPEQTKALQDFNKQDAQTPDYEAIEKLRAAAENAFLKYQTAANQRAALDNARLAVFYQICAKQKLDPDAWEFSSDKLTLKPKPEKKP